MHYRLACDSCDYAEEADAAGDAYTAARDHEADHPAHFVDITERQ